MDYSIDSYSLLLINEGVHLDLLLLSFRTISDELSNLIADALLLDWLSMTELEFFSM